MCAARRLWSLVCYAAGRHTAPQQVAGLEPPTPGTVKEYSLHLLLRTGRTPVAGGSGYPSWPPIVEREPLFIEAFKALARLQQNGDADVGTVKVTAFEEDSAPPRLNTCDALIYPDGVRYNGLDVAQLQRVVESHLCGAPDSTDRQLMARQEEVAGLQLLVCCHGARDARCGAIGPPLAAALRRAARDLGVEKHLSVLPVSHIGGHKYAGNVLVYGALSPCDGDWFGGLHARNAQHFLQALVHCEVGVDGGAEDSALRPFWRGRMALSRAEQRQLFESAGSGIEEWQQGDAFDGWEEEEEKEEEELEGERWEEDDGSRRVEGAKFD